MTITAPPAPIHSEPHHIPGLLHGECAACDLLCACGNALPDDHGADACEWCDAERDALAAQTRPHVPHVSLFTETLTCERCGLLPVDGVDWASDCTG